MEATYRIILTKRVAADLQTIFDYVNQRSPENAPLLISRILNDIEGLKLFPHRTVVAGQGRDVKHPVRSLPVGSYVVFFRVLDDERVVTVLRVRHGAQRVPKRFE